MFDTISNVDCMNASSRDLPKFETRGRQHQYHPGRESSLMRSDASSSGGGGGGGHSGRLFGQGDDGVADPEVGGSSRRPAPDMRRLLLNSVNVSRRKSSASKDSSDDNAGGTRHVIRAI
jgi:hypothetical protein